MIVLLVGWQIVRIPCSSDTRQMRLRVTQRKVVVYGLWAVGSDFYVVAPISARGGEAEHI